MKNNKVTNRRSEYKRLARRFVASSARASVVRFRKISWTRVIAAGLALAIIGEVAIAGVVERRQAKAQIVNYTIGDISRILEFYQTEMQEISVDLVRKIIIEQVTKKMIEKVVGGNSGGIGGGAGGTSNNGSGALVSDYRQFLYNESAKDTNEYIDSEFDRTFPSYIDPSVKDRVKKQYDPDASLVADNCVDASTIDFENDQDATKKLRAASQPGCNNLSAAAMLQDMAALQFALITDASRQEVVANAGLVKKDEKSNRLQQSGSTYEGIIQSMLQGVVDVQTNNESAYSSIIGAMVDQLLDEILDQEF